MRTPLTIFVCSGLVVAAAFGLGALVLYRIVQAISGALP